MTGTVLSNLKRQIKNRDGCKLQGEIIDKTGTGKPIGFRCILQISEEERLKFVATGFKYLPDPPETIGVMRKLPNIGLGEHRLVFVYFDDRSMRDGMVFQPLAFTEHGERQTKKESRKKRGERWLNLPRGFGCSLQEYADGIDEPRVEPPEPTGQQTLGDA